MPVVGCLGGDEASSDCRSVVMENKEESSKKEEQFAFLQQTILVQIFRQTSQNNEMKEVSECPSCSLFSESCCQSYDGLALFREFVTANMEQMWDKTMLESLVSLRYQGQVCPGILVLISSQSNHLETIAEAWKRRLLVAPSNTRISQLGICKGCVVKPVLQTSCVSLTDLLCIVLARCRARSSTADMRLLMESVQHQWANAKRYNSKEQLRQAIHSALGQLIRQRRVYYTGKGYFLVTPETNTIFRRSSDIRRSQRSSVSTNSSEKEIKSGEFSDSIDNGHSNNFERSQSLRVSRKSLMKSMAKGGSLRLARRDVDAIINENNESNNLGNVNSEGNGNNLSHTSSGSSGSDSSSGKFERKNSFLVRLFQKSKSSSKSSNSSNISSKKPIIKSFSAQFPPPELIESLYASVQRSELRPTKTQHEMTRIMTPSGQVPNNEPAYVTLSFEQQPTNNNVTNRSQSSPQSSNGMRSNNNAANKNASLSNHNGSKHPNDLMSQNRPNDLMSQNRPNDLMSNNVYASNNYSIRNSPQSNYDNNSKYGNNYGSTVTSHYGCTKNNGGPKHNGLTQSSSNEVKNDSKNDIYYGEYSEYSRILPPPLPPCNGLRSVSLEPVLPSLVASEESSEESSDSSEKLLPNPSKRMSPKTSTSPQRRNLVDTIHNYSLRQEVIYEIDEDEHQDEHVVDEVDEEVGDDRDEGVDQVEKFPSVSDLNCGGASVFKSLTAQKLMAGLSFNSIDTLVEVNAVAEARNKRQMHHLNESTETIDFGVI